jgi:hypothetical protein
MRFSLTQDSVGTSATAVATHQFGQVFVPKTNLHSR